MDPAELRRKNFIRKEQFPYTSALGWEYDSGDYQTAMDKALAAVDYPGLRQEQAANREAFARGETRKLMGIGVAFFTEIVGAGPVKNCDILGLGMFDSCEIRIHPTGSAIARLGTISQGQGHATTFAQILASEIGIPASQITVEEGDTDTAPYGLGTYGSRSTPVAGAATAMAGRKIRAKAQMIAAYLLEVHDDDLEWDVDRFQVKGNPERCKTMAEIAFAAYNQAIPGLEPGLEAVSYYDPPNMTYPFGAYVCVVDVDVDTGVTEIRRFYALDDCGTRINPMVIEGQVHGGLTEALAIAMGQEIAYDEIGNVKGGEPDGLLPADRGRDAVLGDRPHGDALAAPPDRRQGRRREPERRRRLGVLQRGQRRLRPSRADPYRDAARPLAGLADRGAARAARLGGWPKPAGMQARLAKAGYVADPTIAAALQLAVDLKRPLLLEGEAGVGKTEIAKALATVMATRLIRLQCYEGLDVNAAIYEWNYRRQILAIKAHEQDGLGADAIEAEIFSERFLLRRPLLEAISADQPPVLLIDEIDRADEEFEAYLLEILSDFQITIPELGTVRATSIPHVVLTSNRTRELSDALRRRCLYAYVEFPDEARELAIIQARLPGIEPALAGQIARFVQALRKEDLEKVPGIAETLDWAAALVGLEVETLERDPAKLQASLICLLKTERDAQAVTAEVVVAPRRPGGMSALAASQRDPRGA